MPGLNERAARALKPRLDPFFEGAPYAARIAFDPVEFPHRYSEPRDIEVAGLLSACLAYGRAELFKPKLQKLLSGMGPSPAAFVSGLDVASARSLLSGFVYRFNVGTDLAALLMGMGRALREEGSLEAVFVRGWTPGGDFDARWGASAAFTICCHRRSGLAPPSASTCSCAGWCAGLTPSTSASGSASRRRRW
jgi:hypothetical protein